MNIAYDTDIFCRQRQGGISLHFVRLISQLVTTGHKVYIFCLSVHDVLFREIFIFRIFLIYAVTILSITQLLSTPRFCSILRFMFFILLIILTVLI